MRTEKEIKDKIKWLKDAMFKNCEAHYKNEIPEEHFHMLYSQIWDEMVTLYWCLGFSRTGASRVVAVEILDIGKLAAAEVDTSE